MSDTPTDSQPDVPVEPTSQEPQQPQPQQPEHTQQPNLQPDQRITFTGSDGNPVSPTLGEMAEAFRRASEISSEDVESLNLLRRAGQNDPAAAQALFAKLRPVPEEPKEEVSPEVAELRETVQQLQQQLGIVSPVVSQITSAQSLHHMSNYLAGVKEQYPLLNQINERTPGAGASEVLGNLRQLQVQIKQQHGQDFSQLPVQQQAQIVNLACQQAEQRIRAFQIGEIPKPQPQTAASPKAVNDQPSGQRRQPSRYTLDANGNIVRRDEVVKSEGQGEPIPETPVTPPVGGTPPPVAAQPDRLTPKTLRDQMRAAITPAMPNG